MALMVEKVLKCWPTLVVGFCLGVLLLLIAQKIKAKLARSEQAHTPQASLTEDRKKALKANYEKLNESGEKSGEAFDKTVYAIAGATIAFTATYIKDLNTGAKPNFWLYACWALACLAIVQVATQQLISQWAHRKALDAINAELDGNMQVADRWNKAAVLGVRVTEGWLSPLSLLWAILSVLAFVAFIMTGTPAHEATNA